MVRRCAVVVLAITLLGCSTRASRPKVDRTVDPETHARLTKLRAYLGCLDHSKRIFHIGDVYTARFATAAPTADTEMPVQASEDPEKCLEAVKEAKALTPSLPELETPGDMYVKALADVYRLTSAAHSFYDRSSPLYAPARGLALHPKLLAAFSAFNSAQGPLFDQVFQLNRKVHSDQLADREKQSGRNVQVLGDGMLLRAEDLVQFASSPWNQVDAIDTNAVLERLRRFENAFEEFEAVMLGTGQPGEVTKAYWAVERYARNYAIATRQMITRIQDKIPFSDADKIMFAANNQASVVGTPEAVVEAYNRLVDASYALSLK